jgi:ABC-2 type transport system permease protein
VSNILRHELRWNYRGSALWAIALGAITYMMMYLFPSIAHEHAKWDKLISQLPKGILAGFGMDQLRLSNIFGYYGTQIYPLLVLFVAIYAVMLFSALVSREESEGSIEFLISKPISRAHIFWGKVLAGLILSLGFNLVLFLATWASFAAFHTDPYSLSLLAWFGVGVLLITLVFGGFGLLLSVYVSRQRTLNSITIGLTLATYLVGIASAMSDKLRGLRFLSPYQFVDATAIVKDSAVPSGDLIGLLALGVLLAAMAFTYYRSKDIIV